MTCLLHPERGMSCGQQRACEQRVFGALLRDMKAKVVLEIGVFDGEHLKWLLQQTNGGVAIGVDIEYTKARDHGTFVFVGDSHDARTLLRVTEFLDGRKVDVLFIDGDHEFEGVVKDFSMYSQLVRSGGLVCFHDIVPGSDRSCQVWKAWHMLRQQYPHAEITE